MLRSVVTFIGEVLGVPSSLVQSRAALFTALPPPGGASFNGCAEGLNFDGVGGGLYGFGLGLNG